MAQTQKTYVSDGTQTIYTFEFDYISKDFVKVLVDAVEVGFTFTGTYQVTLDEAPAVDAVIIIQRVTDKGRIVDFVDGSVLVAKDLNISALQAIHIAAEADDKASGSLAITDTGAYSAGFRRVSLMGPPVDDLDAVTKAWAETAQTAQLSQAITAKDAAVAAGGISEASASAAQTSEANAAASAVEASASETNAANSAGASAASEGAAATSASNASTSEANVAAIETAVADAVALANGMPLGTVMYFSAPTAPDGWLVADGTPVTALYPDLRTLLVNAGSPFGNDGTDPLRPNLLGEFIRGWDNGRGVDAGRVFGSFQLDEFKSHSHDYNLSRAYDSSSTNTSSYIGKGQNENRVDDRSGQIQNTGGSETRPRNIALLPCIRAFGAVTIEGMADLAALLTAIASQAEAEAGTDNTKLMTPLRTSEAVIAGRVPDCIFTGPNSTGSPVLDTTVRNVGGFASLASNTVTLAAGTYILVVDTHLRLNSGLGSNANASVSIRSGVTDLIASGARAALFSATAPVHLETITTSAVSSDYRVNLQKDDTSWHVGTGQLGSGHSGVDVNITTFKVWRL